MSKENAGVAILNTHTEAENAVKELQRAGFDLKKLSIVGKDYHTEENVVGYYNAGDRMKYWGKLGAFWGGAVGYPVRVCVLLGPRHWPACCGRSARFGHRWRLAGCCDGRGAERAWRRSL